MFLSLLFDLPVHLGDISIAVDDVVVVVVVVVVSCVGCFEMLVGLLMVMLCISRLMLLGLPKSVVSAVKMGLLLSSAWTKVTFLLACSFCLGGVLLGG